MSDNTITPQNIVSIQIQYKQVNPPLNTDVPSVRVNYGSPVRIANITLPEMLYYVKFLEIQAAMLGDSNKGVIAIQSTDPEENTIITVGELEPNPIFGTVTFQVNGDNFDSTNQLTNIANTQLIDEKSANFINSPFVSRFFLPKFTNNFLDDYNIGSPFSAYTTVEDNGDGRWLVTYTGIPLVNGNYTVDFNLNPLIQVVNNSDNVLEIADDSGHLQTVGLGQHIYIANLGTFSTVNGNVNGVLNNGAQTTLQYENASLVQENYAIPIDNTGIPIFSINVTQIVINNLYVQIKNEDSHQVIIGYNDSLSPNAQGSYATIVNGASGYTNTKFIKPHSNNLYVVGIPNLDGAGEFVTLYKKGVQIFQQAISMSGITNAAIGGFEDFDAIDIGAGTPSLVAVQARYKAGSVAGVCAVAPQIVYTPDGAITAGEIAATDTLGTPLAGQDFIVDTTTGNIHSINNVTGVIGAALGSFCVPPISKNVFFINSLGVPVTIDIDGTPYTINALSSKNVLVNSESVLTNNSGVGHTFTMYQSLPPIPANITAGSGTPVLIANAGTYNFPIDITNYNYIRTT